MLRLKDIQDNFLHLLGWEKGFNSDLLIANSLTESESGLYYQGIHPLLTLDNLNCIAPIFNTNYPEYDENAAYKAGTIIIYAESLYKALQDTEGTDPLVDTDYWEETSDFSEWLEQKTKASISKMAMAYYNEAIVKNSAKHLVESKTLFDGTGRLCNTVASRHRLAGLEIVPIRAKGITTKINKIGLQFTKPGTYTLYLMHSSSEEPIRKIQCEVKKGNTMEWFAFKDLYMPYISNNTDAGGSWYLVYIQDELPEGSAAIFKDYDWSKGPCSGCSRTDFIAWQAWSKYLEVNPFYTSEYPYEEGELSLWDIANNEYDYKKNFGINLELTVECDLTDFFIEQKELFVDVLGKQLAVDILREFCYNPNVRTNRHSISASRTDVLFALDGGSSELGQTGLVFALQQALKALRLTFRGADRICQPCNNNGVKYRTV